jgi:hypothetical protein
VLVRREGYYLKLIGTNASPDDPWMLPEGHTVIGRCDCYLMVKIQPETSVHDEEMQRLMEDWR